MNDTNGDTINHDLVNEFLQALNDELIDNDGGYFSGGIYRTAEIMFNGFFKALAQIYDMDNQVTIDTETAGEKVKKIYMLYVLFRGIGGGNKQLSEFVHTFGEFCKMIELREFIFNEIMHELKSIHIHRGNKNDLYRLLSAMDSDCIFRHGYLQNHNVSRKLFDDIFKRVEISTGNLHKTDDEIKDEDNKNSGDINQKGLSDCQIIT
jgi:hypothetical protein